MSDSTRETTPPLPSASTTSDVERWAASRVSELRKVVLSGQAAELFASPELVAALEADRAVRELELRRALPLRREQASCAERARKAHQRLMECEWRTLECQWNVDALVAKMERLQRCLRFIENDWTEENA